jgi:hypothetical protein
MRRDEVLRRAYLLRRTARRRLSKIYREKVIGEHSDRRELLKMLDTLAPATW